MDSHWHPAPHGLIMSKVYIERITDGKPLGAAVERILGADDALRGHKTVLIKPNLASRLTSRDGVTTDLDLVKEVVIFLKKLGTKRVIVGESSILDTEDVLRSLGVYGLGRYGAEIVNFDAGNWVEVATPLPLVMRKMRVPDTVLGCDCIITMPKMKTHVATTLTLGIKNLLGCISMRDRRLAHYTDLDQGIAEAYAYFARRTPILAVADGIYALEGKLGPTAGNPVRMDVVVGGADCLAVDTTCAEIMGCRPSRVRHLCLCRKHGLGPAEAAEIIGEPIANVRRKLDIPGQLPGLLMRLPADQQKLINDIFRRRPVLREAQNCTLCGRCMQACPKGCIFSADGRAAFDYAQCLSCFICLEACNQKALGYKVMRFPRLYRTLKNLRDALRRT